MPDIPSPHFLSAGRFVSRGHGRHPVRTIDSLELIIVLSGRLDIFEEEREFHVEAGERLFLLPFRRHGGLAAYEPDLTFFWMHAAFEKREDYACFALEEPCAPVASPEFAGAYLQLLLGDQRRGMLEGEGTARENLDALSAILLREALRTRAGGVGRSTLTDAANQYIRIHFDEALTTSEIAAHLQCHPDYLSRLYSQVCGCTVGDAIRRERIRKACEMLERSNAPVKQIAYEAGYGDVSYFRKQFFRECAMTPKEYRNLRRRGHVNTE